jgi:hypothetical protein
MEWETMRNSKRLSGYCSVLICIFSAAGAFAQISSPPYIAINQAEIDGQIWSIPGDGTTDATAKLQAAVTYAVAHQRTLLLRRPANAYKITAPITVGTGASVIYGLDIKGVGLPRILWAGSGTKPMLDIISVGDSRFENLWLDGAAVANTTGVRVRCTAGHPGQHLEFRGFTVQNCARYGVRVIQDANATCDYMVFEACTFASSGEGLHVEGDMRQIDVFNCSFLNNTTHGIHIQSGRVNVRDALFAGNGSGSYYLGSNLASLNVFGSVHEENPVLTTGGNSTSYSPLTSPINLMSVKQDLYVLPFPAGPAIDYNDMKALKLDSCIFVQDVNIGSDALGVQNINTEFVPFVSSGLNAGFTGHTEKLGQMGIVLSSVPGFLAGPFRAQLDDTGWDKTVTLEFDGSWDNESWPLGLQLPLSGAMTLYDVYAYAIGSSTPTLTFNLEERAAATINTAGVDIFGAPVTATAAGAHLTTFANAGLAAGSHIWWKTGAAAETGTVDEVKLVFKAR